MTFIDRMNAVASRDGASAGANVGWRRLARPRRFERPTFAFGGQIQGVDPLCSLLRTFDFSHIINCLLLPPIAALC
jgi:hypothetical protein